MDATALLVPIAEAPGRSALVFDVDGTLAPIVERPELARVPEATRAELRRLAARYALVACISGRPGAEAATLVAVDGVRYVGNHGLELDPLAAEHARAIARFRREVDGAWPVEDKGLSLSFHYREAANEEEALGRLRELAGRAVAAGLAPRWGRKVLEVRPAGGADKGVAVARLLAEAGVARALYAGDDATDLDGFRGLGEAELEHAVLVAVRSAEAPRDLVEAADIVVEGPAGLVAILEAL